MDVLSISQATPMVSNENATKYFFSLYNLDVIRGSFN